MSGSFVISLDFELLWGMRDLHTKESYGRNVLGVRAAIPRILEIFERRNIHATWATVGFVMCEGKDDLLARAPSLRPNYVDPKLSSYFYLDEAGSSEKADPYYFAPSLVKLVQSCPGQEIGTHTFSHYYPLEPGQTVEQFQADLGAATKLLGDWGLPCKSIVFPRNQYSRPYLEACRSAGLTSYRGNEAAWCYRAARGTEQTRARRITRLADAYVNLTGANDAPATTDILTDVASSRFLRPVSKGLGFGSLERHRLRRIAHAMTHAAKRERVFHLWWHPHNFGQNLAENCAFLNQLLDHYDALKSEYAMTSRSMAEVSAAVSSEISTSPDLSVSSTASAGARA